MHVMSCHPSPSTKNVWLQSVFVHASHHWHPVKFSTDFILQALYLHQIPTVIFLIIQHLATDGVTSVYLRSWNAYCLGLLLAERPTSRTASSSSGTQKAPFHWKPSLDAHHTRMGDISKLGTRTQSVINPPYNIYSSDTLCRFRYHSRQRVRHIPDYSKLIQSCHRPSW